MERSAADCLGVRGAAVPRRADRALDRGGRGGGLVAVRAGDGPRRRAGLVRLARRLRPRELAQTSNLARGDPHPAPRVRRPRRQSRRLHPRLGPPDRPLRPPRQPVPRDRRLPQYSRPPRSRRGRHGPRRRRRRRIITPVRSVSDPVAAERTSSPRRRRQKNPFLRPEAQQRSGPLKAPSPHFLDAPRARSSNSTCRVVDTAAWLSRRARGASRGSRPTGDDVELERQ
mmetsp:Transcript_23042/g.72212  ORF Transcript_23042/g.72212 Transcript_23042/m.72212 type:complete len:228 (+) Transcript_23042:215-898(+)